MNFAPGGIDALGEEGGGFNFSFQDIGKGAGEGIDKFLKSRKDKKAKEEAAKFDSDALESARAADLEATRAVGQGLLSAEYAKMAEAADRSKPGDEEKYQALVDKAQADAEVARLASERQDRAGANLSPAGAEVREKEARAAHKRAADEAASAQTKLLKDPKNRALQIAARSAKFKAQAAGLTAVKAAYRQAAPAGGSTAMVHVPREEPKPGDVSFLSKKIGPVPYWGIGLGLLGGGVVWWMKRK